ncbi:MAG: protein kinase, partial [Myxococcales bacterium]|nr:protein kinase [Myxococcales bacterium]
MKSCPSCGADAEPAARFCLECGHAFDEAAQAPVDPWSGRLVAGRYRLLSKLGDGGMGEVFRAEQLPMGRLVAVKTLRQALADDAQAVERFKREAQAASQLAHPNTITVHDFGQDEDGTLFIAMELLDGEGLDVLLERESVLRPDRIVRILAQVCGSLAE